MKTRLSPEHITALLMYVQTGGLAPACQLLPEIEALVEEVQDRRADDELFFLNFELEGVGSCRRGPWYWNVAQSEFNALLVSGLAISDARLESLGSVLDSMRGA